MAGSRHGSGRCGDSNATIQRMRGHAVVQKVRRGHYDLGCDARPLRRVAADFTALAHTI
jgi:hypothetical protein